MLWDSCLDCRVNAVGGRTQGRAHAEARGSESADDGYGGYQRRRPQQRRPEKSAALGSGSPAAQGSPVMPVHGTVAFAHAGAATPSQAQRKRKVLSLLPLLGSGCLLPWNSLTSHDVGQVLSPEQIVKKVTSSGCRLKSATRICRLIANDVGAMQVHKPANGQGRGLPAGVPVKSAAEAFVENDLSASTVQRKPRKAAPVTVQ